ncbi:MAG: M14 family zinc carboxypeptidase [Bacillota bacterium]
MTYVVRPGDSLWAIARRFGITVQELLAANPQIRDPASIQPGLRLRIPVQPGQQYVVQPGDTLWAIARRFGLSVAALQRANPGVDPLRLRVGQRLVIPSAAPPAPTPTPAPAGEIVIPRENYGYDEMMTDLTRLRERYPFIQVTTIGESVMGRSIPAVRIGAGAREVHYNGSFHAHEWITTPLLMKFIEVYLRAYTRGERIGQFDIPRLFRETSLWVVPMVNPDGVEIVQNGIRPDHPYYDLVMRALAGRPLSVWAANIRGVDLNNQFPANWEQEARRGPPGPAPRDYAGPSPLSEPESQAMATFTRNRNFRLVAAFHSQGEVIFWGFEGYEPPETERIVQIFAEASGYTPIRYAGSSAGYKDWFEQEWRRPGFTVEVGKGVNPLPFGQFWEIWGENIGIMLAGLAV